MKPRRISKGIYEYRDHIIKQVTTRFVNPVGRQCVDRTWRVTEVNGDGIERGISFTLKQATDWVDQKSQPANRQGE